MGTPILVLCEGSSDDAFLQALIKKRKLDQISVKVLRDDEKQFSGVTGFGERLKGLQAQTGLADCKLVVIMADNDGVPARRFKEVQKQIRQAGNFGIPSKPREIVPPIGQPGGRTVPNIMVLMLPWDDECGCLETLCVTAGTAKNPGLGECVQKFVTCIGASQWDTPKAGKLMARCMLSATAKRRPDIPLGAAWRSGNGNAFPLSGRTFGRVVRFLRALGRRFQGGASS